MSDVLELENVKIERDGGTTFIILNCSEKRNAMSPQLHLDMCDALDWAEEDAKTRVVVLIYGAGINYQTSPSPPLLWCMAIVLAAALRPSLPMILLLQLMMRPLVYQKSIGALSQVASSYRRSHK